MRGHRESKRRDAMAQAAAPYLHSKRTPLSAVDAPPAGVKPRVSVQVSFVDPPEHPED